MSNAKQIGNKQWPHSPEALLRGRLVYNVKFYGDQEVQQPKGTEPIREAVRKMKFNKQLRKAEGQKVTPKVELHINVDGISIQDPKTKVQQFKFPLHHISYCADDKTEKKLFTFIAKDGATGRHHCFVLGSERNAEEITLTIGQAFDLAYKRFLDKQGNQMEKQKQFMLLQQQVQTLQDENKSLKKRVAELEAEKGYANALNRSSGETTLQLSNSQNNGQQVSAAPQVGTKLEGLLFDDDFAPVSRPATNGSSSSHDIFDMSVPPSNNTAPEIPVRLAPPPTSKTSPRTSQQTSNDLISQSTTPQVLVNPFGDSGSVDAFGMPSFNPNELQRVSDELEAMQHGFTSGLSFGVEDFDINTLDPLNK